MKRLLGRQQHRRAGFKHDVLPAPAGPNDIHAVKAIPTPMR
ncbi:hypothetical protein [Acinetobacter sp. Q85-2]|nr:hypothetical protein [Acinetobacter sp. Q85-2]